MTRKVTVMKNKRISIVWMGVLLALAAGCASTERAPATVRDGVQAVPEPGTRAYYEAKIKGRYALDEGRLLPIRTSHGLSGTASPPLSPPMPSGIVRSPGSPRYVICFNGSVMQVLSNNVIAVSRAVTNASGAVTYPLTWKVTLPEGVPPPRAGTTFGALIVQSGAGLYRAVAEPSYEEYREVYERESVPVPLEPLTSLERVQRLPVSHRPVALPSGVVRGEPAAVSGREKSEAQTVPSTEGR